ncbi:MAG: AMP-binding protein [Rikenellaceae bacterium]|nr:AMP-binding protein [Rikenellaceae bacterium]
MEHYLTLLENRLRRNWEKPALSDYRGETFTSRQVAENFERLHLIFNMVGIKPGDKIALSGPNCAHWAMAFFAVTSYRAVVVPLLADFTPADTAALIDHSEAKLLLVDTKKWEQMEAAKMPQLKCAVNIENYNELLYSSSKALADDFATLDAQYNKKYPKGLKSGMIHYACDKLDELQVINYTSGTTGQPKGIMLTGRNISSNIDFALRKIPVPANASLVSMLPMAHMYGLAFEFLYPFCGGAHVYFLGRTPSPTVLMAAFQEVKPYILITAPLVIEKVIKGKVMPVLKKPLMRVLSNIPVLKNVIYKKIREQIVNAFGGKIYEIVMGGAALSKGVERVLRNAKIPYTVGYGMTECAPLVAYEDWHDFVPASCGKIVTHHEIRVDSADPQKKPGELQVRGANVMIGYYKNEEATAAAFTEDGWLRTGDLGVIDAAGNIFIRGRSKCMILTSNGQNIYPEEIEAKMNLMPYVAESLIVERNKQLVALVAPMIDEKEKAELPPVEQLMEENRVAINIELPKYSQIAKVEIIEGGFVHTPKHSIKRHLYA